MKAIRIFGVFALAAIAMLVLAACGGAEAPVAPAADAPAAQAPAAKAPDAEAMAKEAMAKEAMAKEAMAEEPKIGSALIGKLEGPTVITDSSKWPTTFNEAPQFAELVAQGKLPPVAERIGKDPLVILPVHGVGKYGGIWRRGFSGTGR